MRKTTPSNLRIKELLNFWKDDKEFFIMPDIGSEIANLKRNTWKKKLSVEKKDSLIQRLQY